MTRNFQPKASPGAGEMSFAIEVPGEASPLTMQELCKALEAATSMDNSQRQAAGKQLSTWETQQGYFPSLQVRTSVSCWLGSRFDLKFRDANSFTLGS